jgi:DNA replication protein DnaC
MLMDELSLLKPKLTRLKLSGITETLSLRIAQAMNEKWSFSQFLDMLLSDEVERRDFKQLGRRLTRSGLEPEKTLESFDFHFNPRIHEATFRELATCGFLMQHENLFLVGPSGVGKSHLAQALGHEACRRAREVLYRRTAVLMDWIAAGHGDGTHARRLKQVGAVDLLILDDFGLTPLSEGQQADLYELICERYEKHSLIITSNRDFNEWPLVFANPLMGSAAMDRLVHRAVKIVIEGKSYRVDSFVKRSKHRGAQQAQPEA